MSETLATPRRCVVCNSDSKNLVVDPNIEKIRDILHYARRLADLGEVNLRPLSEFLSSLSLSELEKVTYHPDCRRKKIINKVRLERAKKRPLYLSFTSPATQERPASQIMKGRTSTETYGVVPKDMLCVFAPSSGKCKYHEEKLHKVVSDNRGQTLLDIKADIVDDHIRASLSS